MTETLRRVNEVQFLAKIELGRFLPLKPLRYPSMIASVQVKILLVQIRTQVGTMRSHVCSYCPETGPAFGAS